MESFLCLALSNAVLATGLAVPAAIVGRLCRRPAVRHALWLLVLVKLITPPLLPIAVLRPPSDDIDAPSAAPPPAVALPPVTEPSESSPASVESAEPPAVPEPESPAAPASVGSLWMPLLVALWLGGAFVWWIVAGWRLRRFQRLLHQARRAPEEIQEQARRLAALLGLRRCPPVAFVAAPLSPMLWALGLSPRLLVPAELWQRLDAEQQDTLLAHELAHLRRGDHWVRRLEFLVLGLYWWHPVVWWARRRLQEAEEECCDALVVAALPEAAPAYAAALVETVAFLSHAWAGALMGASGAGQVPLLKRRLTMILTDNPSRRPSRLAFWLVFGLGVLLLPLAPRVAWTEVPEKPRSEEAKGEGSAVDADWFREAAHVKPLTDAMRGCASCHSPVPVQDLHGKPPSWREAHDEAVRLMDEVNRLRGQLRNAPRGAPAAQQSDRGEEIEKLKDEIELLKLQVRLKETQLRTAKSVGAEYRRRAKTMEETNRRQPGAIPRDTLMETDIKARTLESEAEIREVELQEAMIRLKQAERRLARLQKSAEEPSSQSRRTFTHDFGKVKQGTILKFDVPIVNGPHRPIRITRIASSTGCLTAEATKKDIPPGERASIHVELDTRRFTGEKTVALRIQFEAGPELEWRFHAISEAGASDAAEEKHLRELERRLENLQKEIHDLRRELEPKQPPAPNAPSPKSGSFAR